MVNGAVSEHPKLLVVDDDGRQRELCGTVLKRSGYSVLMAASPREAISLMAQHAVDLAILDFEMPEMHGGRLADQIRARYRDIRIILYSGAIAIPKSEITNIDAFVPKGRGAASLLAKIAELTRARKVWYGIVQDSCTFLDSVTESYGAL